MNCLACLSQETQAYIPKPKDREYFVERSQQAIYMKCAKCGSLFQNPWPSEDEASSFYQADYQNYCSSSSPGIARLFKYLSLLGARSFVKKFGRDSKVLDYGCNQGYFLELLSELGCRNLFGFDVIVPEQSGKRSFDFYSNLDELKKSNQMFDVIRMNHVIEHLSDLDDLMNLLSSKLTPGGVIVGETPNAGHHTLRWMKDYWGALHYPYHTVLFTPEGLESASQRWGLEVKTISPSLMPTGWAMSLENFMKEQLNLRNRGRSQLYVLYLLLTALGPIVDRFLTFITGTAIMEFSLKKI